MSDQITIDIKHGKDAHTVKVPTSATLNDLKAELARITHVPVPLQRITGKPAMAKEDAGPKKLTDLGLKLTGSNKLMLVGSAAAAVQEAIAEPRETKKAKAEFKTFPVPFWRMAPVAGLLADNFVEAKGQGLEGASLHEALVVIDLLLTRVNPAGVHAAGLLKQLEGDAALPAEMSDTLHPFLKLTPKEASALSKAHNSVRRGAELAAKLSQIVKPEEVPSAVDAIITAVKGVSKGDWAMLPFGFIGMKERATMTMLVTPVADGVFRAVLVNRGVGASDYHASVVATEHKVKVAPVVDFGAVPEERMLDRAWWLLALSQWMRSNDPNVVSEYCRVEVLYDVLLPWLLQKAPADTGVDALSTKIEAVTAEGAATGARYFATPMRSEASALKGALSAVSFMLRDAGVAEGQIKSIKFAVRYEAMMRSAGELMLAARRWSASAEKDVLPPGVAATAAKSALPASCATKMTKAIANLESCGVSAADATISLDTVFGALGPKDGVKNNNGAALSQAFFARKVVAVYFSGAWCGYCKQVTPLLKEAHEMLQAKFPRMFEVIFVSVDRNPQEYSEHVKDMDWPRLSYPPPEDLVKACDVTGVPKLLLFGPDGALMTSDGVAALKEDPDVTLFPHAPWNGAKPLTDTDARLLSIGVGHVAYHAVKRADAGVMDPKQLLDVEAAMSAIRGAVRAMPRRPGGTNDITFPHGPDTAASASEQEADRLLEALKGQLDAARDTGFVGLDLLRNVSADAYLGAHFDSQLPELGDTSALTRRPTSLKELDTLLARATSAVGVLWGRAKHASTASRVAVQCGIMELVTTLFCITIPMPNPAGDDFYHVEGFLTQAERDKPSGGDAPAAAAADDANAQPQQQASTSDQFEAPGEDMQLDMLLRVYKLALSLTTAWQSVDVPTRAFDSERCVAAMAMLTVFDAVARNQVNSVKCQTLSVLLGSGQYHLSTTLCRNSRPLEEVFATLEIIRPALLHTRASIIEYHREMKARFPNEAFDMRMVDKFEVRKYSHTVAFLRSYMDACGYQLSERPQPGGMMMPPQSEMEQLMGWLCDRRTPIHREHPEFTATRDIVLLAKFLATMDSRDSQLLRQKKETDEWATWRITFDEDTPGRQMSAGWRTRPEPPVWEMLMVRGRDMDIADITVRGFGDRELLYGEGLVVASPSDVAGMLNLERPTEDDILHHSSLPSFGDVLNEEESVHLMSSLTVGYLRIPLVLDFFTTQDRHTHLFTEQLQKLLRSVLFEPGQFVSQNNIDEFNSAAGTNTDSDSGLPQLDNVSVPLRLSAAQAQERQMARMRTGNAKQLALLQDTTALLGSRLGCLANELTQRKPEAVLAPVLALLRTIEELGPSSVYSANASYALFITTLVCDVLSYVRHVRTRLGAPKPPDTLAEYEQRLVSGLENLVVPLLAAWEKEAVEADDTPTQCVVHAHRGIVFRTFPAHAALQQLGRGSGSTSLPALQKAKLVEHVAKYLGECAFVRVRHGFGMGLQRTQLAMQQGDEALSPEQKLLRFLQSQGLDTTRVTTEQLEQGRRLMLSGGRRRAIFVQIRSRMYSDTVRVPNLIYADPGSTADSKALKLPPVDVPEARLFAMVSDDHAGMAKLFASIGQDDISSILNAASMTVLRDRKKATDASDDGSASDGAGEADEDDVDKTVAKAAEATAATDPATTLTAGDEWSASASRHGAYKAARSGLLFHLPSAELFWRHNELRPVPDSMSHFTDYEAVVGKDVLQCGLVSRHEHRHWVHVVGTPYDLCEWTAPNRLDQGVHAPVSASQGSNCSRCGVLGGGCWACEKCNSIVCGHMPPYCRQCRTRKPEGADAEEPVTEATFEGNLYNRPFDVNAETPWPVKKERWALQALTSVYKAAYPMPGEMKIPLLMPQQELDDDADACTLVANDGVQYDEQPERQTWKLIEVRRRPHEVVTVYNLVSHARRMHKVLVYSTNSQMALHSLAPIMKPRAASMLPLMLHHAGEIKKRVQNESTLEIHRHNAALGGRETYVPSRLLQGSLPTSILEHFTFWRGTDDVLRGDGPAADDPWYGYALELRLSGVTNGPAVVIRRPHGAAVLPISQHHADTHRKRVAELGASVSDAVVALMHRQGSAAELGRRSGSVGAHGGSRRRLGRREVRPEDVAMLTSIFPHLPESVCVLALRSAPRGTRFAGAVEWLTSDANVNAVREAVRRAEHEDAAPAADAAAAASPAAAPADATAASPNMGERAGSSGGQLPRQATDFTAEQEDAIAAGDVETAAAAAAQDSPVRRQSTDARFETRAEEGAVGDAGMAYAIVGADGPAEMLVNLTGSPKLQGLAQFLTRRLEDASHILAWAAVPTSVRQILAQPSKAGEAPKVEAERKAKSAQRIIDQLGPLDITRIELPRLRLRLVPRRSPDAPDTVRLHLEDNMAWWIDIGDGLDGAIDGAAGDAAAPESPTTATAANPLGASLRSLVDPFPQNMLLRNAAGEVQVTVPNHEFRPLAVQGDPLSAILLFDRASLTWQETVATPCYQYAVHPSNAFLQPPSLAATFYLVAVFTARQRYGLAMRYAEACHVDTPFTAEERFMFCLLERTLDSSCPDNSPDAHAVRLRLSHCVLHSPNKTPWEVHVELAKYLSKRSHVSADCRLSTEEVGDLLRRCNIGHPIIKARLGVLQAASGGLSRAGLKRPAMLTAGQPWARLLSLPSHTMDTNCTRISRIQYKAPEKPLEDGELVKFLYNDDLLMDEESGSNRQLGFMFLYLLSKRTLPVRLGGHDIGANFAQLLVRYYHLKLARWGREAAQSGESEALPAFSTLALCAMQLNPQEHWPDMRDRRALALMHKGVSIRSQEASETLLPQFWTELEASVRKSHNGVLMPIARSQSLEAMSAAHRLHEAHHAPFETGAVDINRPALESAGRVLPTDTAQDALCVVLPDAEQAKHHRWCPLGAVADAFTLTHEPTAAVKAERAAGMHMADGSVLPFPHLGEHEGAQSPVAKDMLGRLEGDMNTYIDITSGEAKSRLKCLEASPASADNVVADPSGSDADALVAACRDIVAMLDSIRTADAERIRDNTRTALKLANAVWVDGRCVSSADGTFDTEKQRERAVNSAPLLCRHLESLRRQTTPVTFEWLCGALLSTTMLDDLRRANAFHGDIDALKQAVAAVMLSSVRLYFAQQAMQHANAVISFVTFARRQHEQQGGGGDDVPDAERLAGAKNRLLLLVSQLVTVVTAKRFYAAAADADDASDAAASRAFDVDPRFLVFEFMFSILLRQRQVHMVRWFVDNLERGESRVQQMLMGQGKTTVVGPLLALILSTGRSLVTQVMPTPLLEQSRAILRRCFAVVVPKQVYTLQFDRNVDDTDDSAVSLLVQKLEAAERHRAIVVAPPEAIKALLLKIVEQLHAIEDATAPVFSDRTVSTAAALLGLQVDPSAEEAEEAQAIVRNSRAEAEAQALRRRLIARSRMAECLTPVLDLWRRGVLIMDEVDVLLHPLRSELNFPIGHKQPIDCSGPRWLLPMFLLDAVLYASYRCSEARTSSVSIDDKATTAIRMPSCIEDQLPANRQELRDMAAAALEPIVALIHGGLAEKALQREPHVALLDQDFYNDRLRPALTEWLLPWFQHEMESVSRAKHGLPAAQAAAFADLTRRVLLSPSITELADEVHTQCPGHVVQLLLLGRDWVNTIMPHVLSKINRVGYGLLQPHDFATLSAKATEGDEEALVKGMPISRRLLAVPFVAKDVPSRSSEFAHPDVVVGLTVLASRYEGLRQSDVKAMLIQLKQDYSRQSGRRELRPAAVTYNRWVELAAAARREAGDKAAAASVVPLGQLQVLDPVQLKEMHALLKMLPDAIHYNLTQHAFPRTMAFQQLKVSACGHELGSSILFERRVGFSGTPSNLLPLDLGDCSYEPGSDGRIISALVNPAVTSAEQLSADWAPVVLLHQVATARPSFHALIDTGALITNMDNRDVAAYLMNHLPEQFEAVVYLDSADRQMALLRANRLTVPVTQCGVPLTRRFVFFDQNHTTGTDVKQAQTAVAVVTIGKDMVFRDYAQGAYRMRGIGQGQRIHLYITPEVGGRIKHVLGSRHATGRPEVDVPAWLLLNGMRIEALQSVKLAAQEIANVFRKRCLKTLLYDIDEHAKSTGRKRGDDDVTTAWRRCLRFRDDTERVAEADDVSFARTPAKALRYSINEFREDIRFNVPQTIQPPVPYLDRVRSEVQSKAVEAVEAGAKLDPSAVTTIDAVLRRISASIEAEGAAAGDAGAADKNLNSEVVHEQEAEEEQEQEAEQEEQRVSAFGRDDEHPRPWAVTQLSKDPADLASTGDAAFYPMARFRCRPQHRALSTLPRSLQISDNAFRLSWCGVGDRRLKNTVVFIRWRQLANSDSKEGLAAGKTFYAVVTLAEAESLRWLLHHCNGVADRTSVALFLLSGGEAFDESGLLTATGAANDAASADGGLDVADARLWFRFLDNDMFYDDADLARLEGGVLKHVPDRDARVHFFEECLRLRRRHRQQWDDTPVARVLLPPDDEDKAHGDDVADAAPAPPTVLSALEVSSRACYRRMRVIFGRNEKKREAAIGRLREAAAAAAQVAAVGTTTSAAASDKDCESIALPFPTIAAVVGPLLRPAIGAREVAQSLAHGLPRGSAPASAAGATTIAHLRSTLFTPPDPAPQPAEEKPATGDAPGAADTTAPSPAGAAAADDSSAAPAVDEEQEWTCNMCSGRNPWCADKCDFCETAKPRKRPGEPVLDPWSCPQCTFLNEGTSKYCAICNFDSGREVPSGGPADAAQLTGHMEVPEGHWVCAPEKGGCSKFNSNTLFYCEVCDRSRPDLATLRF